MRKITAYKRPIVEPVDWAARQKGVLYGIKSFGAVETCNGEMELVKLRNRSDFGNPETDFAVLVGKIIELLPSGVVKPQCPELWFWRDSFWAKAVSSAYGLPYYRNKRYLLYQIKVVNEDELFASIKIV